MDAADAGEEDSVREDLVVLQCLLVLTLHVERTSLSRSTPKFPAHTPRNQPLSLRTRAAARSGPQDPVCGQDSPDVPGAYLNIGVVYRNKDDLENAFFITKLRYSWPLRPEASARGQLLKEHRVVKETELRQQT
jgi:hypothetical protein